LIIKWHIFNQLYTLAMCEQLLQTLGRSLDLQVTVLRDLWNVW
jgi:hypothetical protein